MDTDTLVDKWIDDGRKLVEELPRRGFDVSAAAWLKASENGKWYFYLVSPLVDSEGIFNASMRLHPLVRARAAPVAPVWIDPMEIRLIGPSHPLARDVLAALSRAPDPRVSPRRWRGTWLGNMSIEAAYLYPPADDHALAEEGRA
jgi:hypothetical protein